MRDRNRFSCNALVVSLLLAGLGTIIQAQDQEPIDTSGWPICRTQSLSLPTVGTTSTFLMI